MLTARICSEFRIQPQAFRCGIPSKRVPDLSFHGKGVHDLVGLVPTALEGCCYVFMDDLACPVQMLMLPPASTSLNRVLELIGAVRPSFKPLLVTGAPCYCAKTETFMPGNAALITSV